MSSSSSTTTTRQEPRHSRIGSDAFYDLAKTSFRDLERVFLDGTMPNFDDLGGWEFRGLNQPAWAKILGIKKFVKGFVWQDDSLYGYNCPVRQTGLYEPWETKPSDEFPKRFGFYRVAPVDATAKDNRYLHAALLDYSAGDNPRFDPSKGLRDYLVQVSPDNRDLFLGKAYYALGPMRVATNFFILERQRSRPGT